MAVRVTLNHSSQSLSRRPADNNEKKDAHHWIYIEFASRRARGNNVDARRNFFLVDVSRNVSNIGGKMKSCIMIVLSLFTLMVQSCGESKEDVSSRAQLSAVLRQINAVYRDYQDNKTAQEQLNLLKVRDYFSGYTKEFRDLRERLAGCTVTKQFDPIRSLSDSVIGASVQFINMQQAKLLCLFDISGNLSMYKEYVDNVRQYENEDYGYRLVREYKIKADEQNIKFITNKLNFSAYLLVEDSVCHRLTFYADTLNRVARHLHFTDTLAFKPVVLDTNDFVRSTWRNVKDVDLAILK